jgi:dethiobiotin synthase
VRGVFVTGTDTGVGKTVLSAALMLRFPGSRYWKPIQTGPDDDTSEVLRLSESARSAAYHHGVRLPDPVSPHLAAQRAGTRIDPAFHVASMKDSPAGKDESWIVEGAGGALVPVNESDLMIHLMERFGLPVLIAARSTLGTINHTLLTIEALRARRLAIAGVVMLGEPDTDNRAAIEHYGAVPVLGEMPRFDPLTSSALRLWATQSLDPEGRLLEFF